MFRGYRGGEDKNIWEICQSHRLRIAPFFLIRFFLNQKPHHVISKIPADLRLAKPIFLVRDYEPRSTLPQWTAGALSIYHEDLGRGESRKRWQERIFLSPLKITHCYYEIKNNNKNSLDNLPILYKIAVVDSCQSPINSTI